MQNQCVFCGAKPDKKSKEHVLPKWLIELTGKSNRKAQFGFIKDVHEETPQKRVFGFDKFTFPACSKCNHEYSSLESRAKDHIYTILSGNELSSIDVSDLLDWFDKVRVGLWLGMRQLNKNLLGIDPSFHIATRIGQWDRMLIIEKSRQKKSRLNVGGIDTMCFSITPSAFLLIINDYYFTNVSSMILCSKRLGFPYIKNPKLLPPHEKVGCELMDGSNRVMLPILRKNILEKGALYFQPMFKGGLADRDMDSYKSDYVKSHSINYDLGIGNIFKETSAGVVEYTKHDKFSLEPEVVQDEGRISILSTINILEWQVWLHKDLPDTSLLNRERQEYLRKQFNFINKQNIRLANHCKKML